MANVEVVIENTNKVFNVEVTEENGRRIYHLDVAGIPHSTIKKYMKQIKKTLDERYKGEK